MGKVSSKTARAVTQRTPVLKNKQNTHSKNKNEKKEKMLSEGKQQRCLCPVCALPTRTGILPRIWPNTAQHKGHAQETSVEWMTDKCMNECFISAIIKWMGRWMNKEVSLRQSGKRSIKNGQKSGVVAHACNTRTWEAETRLRIENQDRSGGAYFWSQQKQVSLLWVQVQPSLQGKFQDRQGYTEKPCLKKQNKN